MNKRSVSSNPYLLVVILCMSLLSPLSQSSTVRQLSFSDIVTSAELIFEGSVTAKQSHPGNDQMIYTYVEFKIIDVLKGDYFEDTVELRFLGGEFEGIRLQVTDMLLPKVGESGFYFVESLSEGLVHPLVGWAQGHYVIVPDADGILRVMTPDEREVQSLLLDGQELDEQELPNQSVVGSKTTVISQGVARGVILKKSSPLITTAIEDELTAEEFKATILNALHLPVKDLQGNGLQTTSEVAEPQQ